MSEEIQEEVRIVTLDDGSFEEEPTHIISAAGNKVINPKLRSKGNFEDPRQQICWDLYVKGWKEGKPSAKAAGLAAGYAYNTAINISNFKWFKDKKAKLRRSVMMSKAERNLSRILDIDYSVMRLVEVGKDDEGKPIMDQVEVIDKDLVRVVADVSKTIVTTLGKEEGYSTKTEVEGKMKGDIQIKSVNYADAPVEVEAKVVDESVKLIEDEIFNQVIPDGDNATIPVQPETIPDSTS